MDQFTMGLWIGGCVDVAARSRCRTELLQCDVLLPQQLLQPCSRRPVLAHRTYCPLVGRSTVDPSGPKWWRLESRRQQRATAGGRSGLPTSADCREGDHVTADRSWLVR